MVASCVKRLSDIVRAIMRGKLQVNHQFYFLFPLFYCRGENSLNVTVYLEVRHHAICFTHNELEYWFLMGTPAHLLLLSYAKPYENTTPLNVRFYPCL